MKRPRKDNWYASYKPCLPYYVGSVGHLELIRAIGRGEIE